MHNKDTYDFERKNKSSKLEYIEWDDLWYQAADNTKMRRVLCIGDSISRGTRPFLNLILNAKNTVVDGLATSKAIRTLLNTSVIIIPGKSLYYQQLYR